MNSEHKNYPMKEFRAIFFINFVHQVRVCEKRPVFNIIKMYGIHINLGCICRMQKLPYERISCNFSGFIDFGHQVRVAKKDHFSILPEIQNIWDLQNVWDLHKFGLQIWIQNAKITLWKNFGQFFINFGHHFHLYFGHGLQVRVCKNAKKDHFSILAVIYKIYGIYINLGCRFEFRTQKLPYERISGNFSDFIDFGHQVRVCKKSSFPSISCTSKCMGFT